MKINKNLVQKVSGGKSNGVNNSNTDKIDNIFENTKNENAFSKVVLNNNESYDDSALDFSGYDIPEGYSHYERGKSYFDIFRRGKDYKSQFVHTDDYTKEDLIKDFPNLSPVTNPHQAEENNDVARALGINGLIDEETIQGATGDCWLISALYSLSGTQAGRDIIKNSITVNKDNTVTIAFAGIGVSYTITKDELAKFDTDDITSDQFSNGDNDILAFELATQKLWQDMQSGRVQLNTDNNDILYVGNGGNITNGGLPSQLIYYLTGVEPNQIYNQDLSNLSQSQVYEVLQNAYKSGNCSLTFGVYNGVHTATLADGTKYEIDLGQGGHALAITDIQDGTLTFVNPWDTSKKYTMTWEEFANMGVGYMCSSDLTKTNPASEIVDMTDPSNEIRINPNGHRTHNNASDRIFRHHDHITNSFYNFFDELIKSIINSKEDKKTKKNKKEEDVEDVKEKK